MSGRWTRNRQLSLIDDTWAFPVLPTGRLAFCTGNFVLPLRFDAMYVDTEIVITNRVVGYDGGHCFIRLFEQTLRLRSSKLQTASVYENSSSVTTLIHHLSYYPDDHAGIVPAAFCFLPRPQYCIRTLPAPLGNRTSAVPSTRLRRAVNLFGPFVRCGGDIFRSAV